MRWTLAWSVCPVRKITGRALQRRSFLIARHNSVPLSFGISRSSTIRFGFTSSSTPQNLSGSLRAVTASPRRPSNDDSPRDTIGSSSTTSTRRPSIWAASNAEAMLAGVGVAVSGALATAGGGGGRCGGIGRLGDGGRRRGSDQTLGECQKVLRDGDAVDGRK